MARGGYSRVVALFSTGVLTVVAGVWAVAATDSWWVMGVAAVLMILIALAIVLDMWRVTGGDAGA